MLLDLIDLSDEGLYTDPISSAQGCSARSIVCDLIGLAVQQGELVPRSRFRDKWLWWAFKVLDFADWYDKQGLNWGWTADGKQRIAKLRQAKDGGGIAIESPRGGAEVADVLEDEADETALDASGVNFPSRESLVDAFVQEFFKPGEPAKKKAAQERWLTARKIAGVKVVRQIAREMIATADLV
ncbi:MAG: hypothetical protein KGR26_13385 [Cyanobacteria bacterium REEB65]|nr:hypothetical protein [Cyanobacteria bacterium REEB65]